MEKEFYEALARPLRKNKWGVRLLTVADRLGTLLMYILYIVLAIIQIVNQNWVGLSIFAVTTAVGFGVVTLLRRLLAVPRRFEVWDDEPLLGRHRPGRSFPSRHLFSATIISLAAAWIIGWPMLIPCGVITLLLAATRVIGGVHYLRDVAVGAGIGALFAGIGFWFVPLLFQ